MSSYDQEESEILEDMSQALSRLNEMSTTIQVEIKEQDKFVYSCSSRASDHLSQDAGPT